MGLLVRQIMLEKEMCCSKKFFLIVIFTCLLNNAAASIKENIINKFQNIENISFKFEQNMDKTDYKILK